MGGKCAFGLRSRYGVLEITFESFVTVVQALNQGLYSGMRLEEFR